MSKFLNISAFCACVLLTGALVIDQIAAAPKSEIYESAAQADGRCRETSQHWTRRYAGRNCWLGYRYPSGWPRPSVRQRHREGRGAALHGALCRLPW